MDPRLLKLWLDSKGDQTLRINYPLNENSIVFDIGGYMGEWTELIYNKYKCNIYIFEPVNYHYECICEKFKNISKIKAYNIGISDHSGKATINLLEYASSLCSNKDGTRGLEEVSLMDINEFINKEKIKFIDIMKINIEGEEYPVLNRILTTGLQYKIDNFQIQFHDFIDDAVIKRNEIQKLLSKTHGQTYAMDFVWENWKMIFNPFKK